jgi:hypothetical protein
LAAIRCGRSGTSLLLLRGLALLWRRRLTLSGLHSFSSGARFVCIPSAGRRRYLLMKSRWRTVSTLLTFSCAQRRRRAEAYSFIVTLRRNLPLLTARGIWLLSWSSHWLAIALLLLRRCAFES